MRKGTDDGPYTKKRVPLLIFQSPFFFQNPAFQHTERNAVGVDRRFAQAFDETVIGPGADDRSDAGHNLQQFFK